MDDRLVHQASDVEGRITTLEIRMAVAESNIKEFGRKLDKIDANISKLTWLVLIAVVGAILKQIGLY